MKSDLPIEDLEILKETLLKNLGKTDEVGFYIEREKAPQTDCSKWLEMRRN